MEESEPKRLPQISRPVDSGIHALGAVGAYRHGGGFGRSIRKVDPSWQRILVSDAGKVGQIAVDSPRRGDAGDFESTEQSRLAGSLR
jgi:hypothetical protein